MTVSENIKRIIGERGLKHCSVAKLAGYSNKQFSDMLNGRKTIQDVDIIRICHALSVMPNDLFKGLA